MARIQRFDDKQMEFISDVLNEHGDFLKGILQDAIQEKKLLVSGDLSASIKTDTSMSGNNPKLSLSFTSYGRAIEIRYHRKSSNTQKFMVADTKSLLYGMRSNNIQRKKKKDTRWYARNVYGSLNRMIGILMYEYGDWVLAKEKAQIEMLNKNIPI
jgi:hypothetical protein